MKHTQPRVLEGSNITEILNHSFSELEQEVDLTSESEIKFTLLRQTQGF